ncbi:MAG: GNAT family N-acetyltransferase [Microbacterium sp.]|nr:GNAT family N-acetyltransferase [Microbacterium sp.]
MDTVTLRPWSEGDFPLLQRANTPAMTAHLNGPESDELVADRHERYLRLGAEGVAHTFVILEGGQPVGSIAYWDVEWRDRPAYETGWFVLPEAQGRGLASVALGLVIADARARGGERRLLTACPGADNAASNGVCRRNGFTLVGETSGEFRDAPFTMNEWVLDLDAETPDA